MALVELVAALGGSTAGWVAVLIPWGVFFLGWIAAGVLTPSGTDNTPILAPGPLDSEHELRDLVVADPVGDRDGRTLVEA